MKYFTLDNWIADQGLDSGPAATTKAVDDYRAYLAGVRDALPADFLRMLEAICIHDARLLELEVTPAGRSVVMVLDAGDITMREGRKIRLHYSGVDRLRSTSDPEKGLPGPNGYGDLGSDEIEVLAGGGYEHRFLFSSGIELALRFRDFRLEVLEPAAA